MSVLYLTVGLAWNDLKRFPVVLVILYSLTFFFANYGPVRTSDENRLAHFSCHPSHGRFVFIASEHYNLCVTVSRILS